MIRKLISSFLAATLLLVSALSNAGLHAAAEADLTVDPETGLPYAFDLRELGLVSAVKNQNPYGTCWAFSTMAALETAAIAQDPDADFSEMHFVQHFFSGPTAPDIISDCDPMNTGNRLSSFLPFILNRIGPVAESDAPYGEAVPDIESSVQEVQKHALLYATESHQRNAYSFVSSDWAPVEVKQALFSGHSVMVDVSAFYANTSAYHNVYHSYYFDFDKSDEILGDSTDSNTSGHFMTIVGWDDHFSASLFRHQPPIDGAWLVKNSWGPEWGDNGYCWISFAEPMIASYAWYDTQPTGWRDLYFSYDDYGFYGGLILSGEEDSEAYYANVFYPEEDLNLTDLMLCSTVYDTKMDITVYTGVKDKQIPVSGEAVSSFTYTPTESGYHTVALPAPVAVNAGEPFSVVVHASGSMGAHLPCEAAYESGDSDLQPDQNDFITYFVNGNLSPDQLRRDFHEQQSFCSVDGTNWKDLYHCAGRNYAGYKLIAGNACIRVLGDRAGKVRFSNESTELPAGEAISLSCAEGTDIYYSKNGGEYQLYSEPIVFDGDMLLSAYADTEHKTIRTMDYKQRHAVLSSLLMRENDGVHYADLHSESITMESFSAEGYIQPISTGRITVNGHPVVSGHLYYLTDSDREKGIVLRVEQDGMLPTEYQIKVETGPLPSLPEGIWHDYNAYTAFDFHNGNGVKKDLLSGKTEAFTYQQTSLDTWTFTYADRTESYQIEIYQSKDPDNPGFRNDVVILKNDNGSHTLIMKSRLSFSVNPVFTANEIAESALQMYNKIRDVKATRVDAEQTVPETVVLDFYNGNTLLETLYADNFGCMAPASGSGEYYSIPQYAKCDFNGDKKISVADAVMMHRFLGEDALPVNPSPELFDAADLDADGVLTLFDAQLFLDSVLRDSIRIRD